ncbi:unnamed protein product [Prunus armeniaca]|uniref:Uncharacterized protein n=1 Tax=Prunus armeniaca TaxID=36596 RepID=A0A6J5U5J5_PRUAR|nr:unnamed protein product [Prunus armeniaca]CAB4302036.1 unnamed protein product [Prunus armeniaca]
MRCLWTLGKPNCQNKPALTEPKNKGRHSAIASVRETISLKIKFQSIDDDGGTDWAPAECKKQKMMMRLKKKNVNEGRLGQQDHSEEERKEPSSLSSSAHHDLPEAFKRKIDSLGGKEVALVIEKELTKTDLETSGNRMSMPLNQITSGRLISWKTMREVGFRKRRQ